MIEGMICLITGFVIGILVAVHRIKQLGLTVRALIDRNDALEAHNKWLREAQAENERLKHKIDVYRSVVNSVKKVGAGAL